MAKLKPMYLYRLRLVSGRPRFYAPGAVTGYLERRGYIERTGRADTHGSRIEYRITGKGRAALEPANEA